MVKFDEDFEAIKIDTEADEKELISLYKEKSGLNIYPAQPVKILLSIFAYQKSLVLSQINECVKNLLLPYAKGIWLDILGFLVGCTRILASRSVSRLKVVLYEEYSFDKTLPKGSQIETSDGLYVFETLEDLIIYAGQTVGYVNIQSVQAGSMLNYKAGEVNSLIDNYEFIESVTNIEDCTGGADDEEDDDYRERIATAPEHYSVAGPEDAYKYFIKSSHKDIVDCAIVRAEDDAYIQTEDEKFIETDGKITIGTDEPAVAIVDYNQCCITIPSGTYDKPLKVCFPQQGEINCYILTKDGEADSQILQTVENTVNADDVKPLCDYVKYFSAVKNEFVFEPTVHINNDADFNTVKTTVEMALNSYFNELKTKLNKSVLSSDLIALIKNIAGVYDVKLNNFTDILPEEKTFNLGKIGEGIEFRRNE